MEILCDLAAKHINSKYTLLSHYIGALIQFVSSKILYLRTPTITNKYTEILHLFPQITQ
jgi:hypothetical protein